MSRGIGDLVGDVSTMIVDLGGEHIEKHCEKKCKESNSVIEKGVYKTVGAMSALNVLSEVVGLAFNAVGEVLSHIFKN